MNFDQVLRQIAGSATDEALMAALIGVHRSALDMTGDHHGAVARVADAIADSPTAKGHTLRHSLARLAQGATDVEPDTFLQALKQTQEELRVVRQTLGDCLKQFYHVEALNDEAFDDYVTRTLAAWGERLLKNASTHQVSKSAGFLVLAEGRKPLEHEALVHTTAVIIFEHIGHALLELDEMIPLSKAIWMGETLLADDYSVMLSYLAQGTDVQQLLCKMSMRVRAPESLAKQLLLRASFKPYKHSDALLDMAPKACLQRIPDVFAEMEDWLGQDPDDETRAAVECLGMLVNAAAVLETPLAQRGIDLLGAADPILGQRMAQCATTRDGGGMTDAWRQWGSHHHRDALAGVAEQARGTEAGRGERHRL